MFIKFRGDLQFCCIIITLSLGLHIANATASDQLVLGHELCLHIGSSDGKKADESSKAQVQECRERRRSSARLHGPRQHAPAGAVPFPMRKRTEYRLLHQRPPAFLSMTIKGHLKEPLSAQLPCCVRARQSV